MGVVDVVVGRDGSAVPAAPAPVLPWELVVSELPLAVAVLDVQASPVQLAPLMADLVAPSALQAAVLASVPAPQQQPADDALPIDLDAPPANRIGRVRSRTGQELVLLVRAVSTGSGSYLLVHAAPAPALPRDALTGLVLRDVLLGRLAQALARQSRSGGELELVVLDLDGFKGVNDRYGHGIGDEVLATVARRVLALSRPQDTVCRWGGDEFVLLLEAPDVDGGASVSVRIADALEEPVPTTAGPLHVGVSVGWVRARPRESAEEVLHRADMVMYAHKRSRRDRSPLVDRLAHATDRALVLRGETDAAVRGALGSLQLLRDLVPRSGSQA